jgi:hypothetical protein
VNSEQISARFKGYATDMTERGFKARKTRLGLASTAKPE